MTECSVCGRPIIWVRMRDGGIAGCDPELRQLSEMPLDKANTNLTSLITPEGVAIKKEFAHPSGGGSGYVPHFYSCNSAPEMAVVAPLLLDRLWIGAPSVEPAKESEGGFGKEKGEGGGGKLE